MYYDIIEDIELIEAAFKQFYNLDLEIELQEMSYRKFLVYLINLDPNSLFKQIVMIRAEKDPERIRNFSKEEKKIWQSWKNRNIKVNSIQLNEKIWNEISKDF